MEKTGPGVLSLKKDRDGDVRVVVEDAVVVFFVQLGLEMPQGRIDRLAARAKEMGAMVTRHFEAPHQKPKKKRRRLFLDEGPAPPQDNDDDEEEEHPLPTHLVVDEAVTAERVAKFLKFSSVEEFENYLSENRIQCALPVWIARSRDILSPDLLRGQRWWKVGAIQRRHSASPGGKNNSQSQELVDDENDNSDDEDELDLNDTDKNHRFPNNVKVAARLKELSKLHAKCPIDKRDPWKAYSLDKAAGKILHLDFELNLTDDVQKMLKNMNGIGASTQGKINQVLKTGTIDRIAVFRRDPERRAMKVMMNIWGVGRSTATKLIQTHQCRTIKDVRRKLKKGKLQLDRNQRIGVDCHEDFQEQMTREEVEAIGETIEKAVRRQFTSPSDQKKLEITIMGSYRRGKEECGDVDVLITHQDYVNTVPPQVLGEVVEELLDNGHMAHHLTFISGMKVREDGDVHPGGYNHNDEKPKKPKKDNETGSSYMGVFHSPKVPGKRRRVDIKFYPHRNRAFAWIHFTGCGFFNRSIRQYADVCHKLQLSDKGLFKRGTKERVLEASTEKEVFDFLGLEYKEPHERDGFDAVVWDDDQMDEDAVKRFFEEDVKSDLKFVE